MVAHERVLGPLAHVAGEERGLVTKMQLKDQGHVVWVADGQGHEAGGRVQKFQAQATARGQGQALAARGVGDAPRAHGAPESRVSRGAGVVSQVRHAAHAHVFQGPQQAVEMVLLGVRGHDQVQARDAAAGQGSAHDALPGVERGAGVSAAAVHKHAHEPAARAARRLDESVRARLKAMIGQRSHFGLALPFFISAQFFRYYRIFIEKRGYFTIIRDL